MTFKQSALTLSASTLLLLGTAVAQTPQSEPRPQNPPPQQSGQPQRDRDPQSGQSGQRDRDQSGQQKRDDAQRDRQASGDTLTGCLAKDTQGNYTLTHETSGEKTAVTGSADLEKHATHKVTLTGSRKDESGKSVFHVTKIQHISATCTAPSR
jgi:hypothetical protein